MRAPYYCEVVYEGTVPKYETGGHCYTGSLSRIILADDGSYCTEFWDRGWVSTGDDIETALAIFRQAFADLKSD